MSQSKTDTPWTPGPWWTDARYRGADMGCSIIAARTDCGPLPGNPTRGQVAFATAILNTDARKAESNARLIAAAPKLVKALHNILRCEMDRRAALRTGSPAAKFSDERIAEARAVLRAAGHPYYQETDDD